MKKMTGCGSTFFCVLVLFILFSTGLSLSIEYHLPYTQDPLYNVTRWNSFKEISGYGLNCIGQTIDSTMWFGTDRGTVSYDGLNWTLHDSSLGLRNPEVVTFLRRQNGDFLAANNSGLALYKNNTWQPYLTLPDILCYYFDIIETPDSTLWLPMQFGFLQIDNDKIRLFTTENRIKEYLRRKDNKIFLANGKMFDPAQDTIKTKDTVYLSDYFSSTRITVYKINKVEKDLNIFLKPRELIFDSHRNLFWFTLKDGEIGYIDFFSYLEGENFDYELYTAKDGLVQGKLTRLSQTRDGAIWGISDDNLSGVNVFKNNQWEHFKLGDLGGYDNNCKLLEINDEIWISGSYYLHILKNDKWKIYPFSKFDGRIPSNKTIIFNDVKGNIWFAGEDQFVVCYKKLPDSKMFIDNAVFQFIDADNAEWFIRNDGSILAFQNHKWKRYGVKDNIMSHPVKMVQQKNGNIWVAGSHHGRASTAVFRNNKWERTDHGDVSWSIEVKSLFVDRDDHLWLSGAVDYRFNDQYKGGILEYIPENKNNGKWIRHADLISTVNVAYSITQTPDGRIWIGGIFGLRVYNNGVWEKAYLPIDTAFIADVVKLDSYGNLWVATRGFGIFIFDGQDWYNINIHNGLLDNTIREILFMDNNRVLVSTMAGINHTVYKNGDYKHLQWFTIPLPEELSLRDFNYLVKGDANSFWLNSYSEQWFLQSHPQYQNLDHKTENAHSQKIIYEQTFPETFINMTMDKVTYKGSLVANWRGVEFGKPEQDGVIYYSYRIDDENWSLFSIQTTHTFSMLESGKHCIQVRAMNQDLNIDPTPAEFKFNVLPPIWKQGWFLVLLISFVLVITVLIINIVHKNIELGKKNEIQKKQLVAIKEAQRNIASMAKFPNENPSPVLRIDKSGLALFANESSGQLLTHWDVKVGSSVPDYILALANKADEEKKVQEHIEKCNKEYYKLAITPIIGEHYYNIYGMEITNQIVFEKQLEKSLSEKEVLLKEIHHRVKNNLQIISSLLYLQARNHSEESVQNIIEESRNRVKTIALVHEKLYQSNDLSNIDFKMYIKGIVDHINYLFKDKANDIHVVIDIPDDLKLDLDHAIPCGLVVNELVTNAFKYAYPHKNGNVYLKLIVENSDIESKCTKHLLSIWDEGVGIPKEIDVDTVKTLGLRLVQNLVGQLEGEIQIKSDDTGTRFDISYLSIYPNT